MEEKVNPKDVKIGVQALSGGAAKFFLLAIGFVGTVVFARVLGATGFGAFYILVHLENVIDRPLIGYSESAKKRMSEYGSDREKIYGAFYIGFAIFNLIAIVGIFIFKRQINSYIGNEYAHLFMVSLLVALSLQETMSNVYSSTGKVGFVTWVDSLRSLITIPLQIGLILIGLDLFGMVFGLVFASLVTPILIFYRLNITPKKPSSETFKSMFNYAKYSIPKSMVSYNFDKIALLAVGYYMSPEVAGYFGASVKLTTPALAIGMVASSVLMPKISNITSIGDDFYDDLYGVMSFSSVLAIPILFGALSMSNKIMVTVYGNEFAEAAKFLGLIALYRIIETRNAPLVNTIQGLDLPKYDMHSTYISFITMIVSGYLLIQEFGGIGAAIAIVIAGVVRYVCMSYFLGNKIDKIPHFTKPFLGQVVAGISMYIVLESVLRIINLADWYHTISLICVGGVVYFVILLVLSGYTRHTIKHVAKDMKEKFAI